MSVFARFVPERPSILLLLRTIVADVGGMGSVVAIHAYFLHIMIIDDFPTYMVGQC